MATKHEMAQTTGQGEQSNFPMLAGKKQTVIPLPQLLNSKRAKMQTFKKGKETGTTDRYCTEPINREPNQEGCVMEDGRVDRYIYIRYHSVRMHSCRPEFSHWCVINLNMLKLLFQLPFN